MSNTVRIKVQSKAERPRLHKVILVNDDYTPREFVVTVLTKRSRGRSCRFPDNPDRDRLPPSALGDHGCKGCSS